MRLSNLLKRCGLLTASICILLLTGCGRIPDGEYAASVTLTGGSGRAYVESPCRIIVSGKEITADIVWSSENYDFMVVDGVRYDPVNSSGNSEFIIPAVLGKEIPVQADTTAMSKPHLIDYTLKFELMDDGKKPEDGTSVKNVTVSDSVSMNMPSEEVIEALENLGLKYVSSDEILYATGFGIHRFEDGYVLISVRDGRNYLIIPENGVVSGLPELGRGIVSLSPIDESDLELIAIRRPLDSIYLAASAVMCQFDAIDAVDLISLSGTQRDDWYVEAAIEAMDTGSLLYGGKYSAPDYEMMVAGDVDLAIENTMILHSPKVIEKLEKLQIPAFIDWSSYEESVAGRLEWIRVYGVITGKEAEAERAFLQQKEMLSDVDGSALKGKSVAVFSVNTRHQIITKKRNDYLVKMIEASGAKYLLPQGITDDGNQSQVTISVEAFYDYAGDADILIYNGAIEEPPASVQELAGMDAAFGNLKAVKTGQVYIADKSLYQFASESGLIQKSIYEVLSGQKEDTDYIYRLK